MQKRMLVHWVHPLKSEKAIYRDLPRFTLIGPEQQLSTSKETGEELRYKKIGQRSCVHGNDRKK